MTDQPVPTPGDEPEDSKRKRPRADIRQEYLDELTLATEVAKAAAKPEYAAKLLEEAVEAADVAALVQLVADTRAQIADTGSKATGQKSTTMSEAELKDALVMLAGKIQARAKRTYDRGDPRRDDYYVGKAIGSNRPQLEQASAALLKHAAADPKMKVGPELLAQLETARTAYVEVQGEQTGKKAAATTTRETMAAMVKAVAKARRNIQYAADAAWPAKGGKHTPIRREFKIPATRKLQ